MKLYRVETVEEITVRRTYYVDATSESCAMDMVEKREVSPDCEVTEPEPARFLYFDKVNEDERIEWSKTQE